MIQEEYENTVKKGKNGKDLLPLSIQVEHEFIYELSKDYVTPWAFQKKYFSEGNIAKYAVASKNSDVLAKLASNFKRHIVNEKPVEPMVNSLFKYCNIHERPSGDLYELVRKHNLDEPILKMFQTYFKHGKTKLCTYWHFGAPNTGKTKIKDLLNQIFHCQTLKYCKGGWPTVYEPKEYAT